MWLFLQVWDEAKRLRCEWYNDYEKTASKPPMKIADLEVVELNFRGEGGGGAAGGAPPVEHIQNTSHKKWTDFWNPCCAKNPIFFFSRMHFRE